jgi:hypothetical protein
MILKRKKHLHAQSKVFYLIEFSSTDFLIVCRVTDDKYILSKVIFVAIKRLLGIFKIILHDPLEDSNIIYFYIFLYLNVHKLISLNVPQIYGYLYLPKTCGKPMIS